MPNRPVTADRVNQLKNDLMKLSAEDIAQNVYIDKAKEKWRDISGEYLGGEVVIGILA